MRVIFKSYYIIIIDPGYFLYKSIVKSALKVSGVSGINAKQMFGFALIN